jgi:hypothetical protein
MLFMQSVTYIIAEPDDGECEKQVTIASCLSIPSTLAKSANKCYWDGNGESCMFLEPSNDLMRVVYVSLLSAMISAPISITVDWLVMNVLTAETVEKSHFKIGSSTKRDVLSENMDKGHGLFLENVDAEIGALYTALRKHRTTLSSEADMREFDGKIYN